MNQLPTNYVYRHIDPDSGETVYIGMGTSCRAFRVIGGHRSNEHKEWLESQYSKGNCPVVFEATGLTKTEAHDLERNLIHEEQPLFNKLSTTSYLNTQRSGDVELWEFASLLKESGYTLKQIAELLGLNPETNQMTVSRYIKYHKENINVRLSN